MALSQDDRIVISKKIVDIPRQNAQAAKLKDDLEAAKIEAEKEDNSNKTLMDVKTALVNPYQTELERYNSDGHNQLLEQDLLDAADRKLQNFFFPNDPQTPIPSVPDGVWKNFPAFSGSKAIGKTYTETFTPVTKEQDLIDAINTEIAIIEALVAATRSSGDECVPGNPGPIPPASPDVIQSSATMQAAATAMITAVQAWEDFMNATSAIVPTSIQDPDPTRLTQNDASRQDITDAIVVVDTWQALQNFDTTTATPITCAAFDSFAASNFNPSKFRVTELTPLKTEITAREAFIVTRDGQLNTNLGSVTQDFDTGEILAVSGFHGDRFRFIDMRLNAIGGSLSRLKSIERGQDAQEQIQASNDNAAAAYDSVMKASQFRAPAKGNVNIHVLDASDFSTSDAVFVVANDQSEIPAVIQSIDGNRIVLDVSIPEKYRETDLARIYKVL